MATRISQSSGILRPLLLLVWPVFVEQLLVLLVGLSDTFLAGRYLAEEHLAAMTVMNYLLWTLTNLFAVVSIGALAMVARFVGGEDWTMANRVVNQALLLGVMLAIVFTAIGLPTADRLIGLMQLSGEPAALATRYLHFIVPMLPAIMCEQVSNATLRGAGDMVTPLVSMTLVNVVNITVAWSLLLGLGPLPQLGWDALPIGAACGHAVGGIIPLTALLWGRAGLRVQRKYLRPDRPLMRRILRIGLPGGLDIMAVITCQLVYLSQVTRLGEVAAAAHGVALRIESLAYLPGYAFQVAAATLVGQYLGARDPRRAGRSVLVASGVSTALLTVVAIVILVDAEWLVSLLLGPQQAEVAEVAPRLLRIVAFALPPLAVMQVLTGALRGAGDTRWPLAFTFIGFLGVRLPLVWLLTRVLDWGVVGAWYAMAGDIMVRCALITFRFGHGGWKKVEV